MAAGKGDFVLVVQNLGWQVEALPLVTKSGENATGLENGRVVGFPVACHDFFS